jgi:uncharacterized protein YndB with AHSA1/START domain
MKMWQKILIVAGVLVVAFVVFVATRPSHFHVERSTEIAAPAEKIYPLTADFHEWPKWSPWEKKDANMKKTFSGAPNGVGAIYEWEGNKDVGKGRMTVTAAEPGKSVTIKLEFLEPFPTTNIAKFDLVPTGDKTKVTWNMDGEAENLMHKMFTLMMDGMIGPDFEAGLANMKTAAEAK